MILRPIKREIREKPRSIETPMKMTDRQKEIGDHRIKRHRQHVGGSIRIAGLRYFTAGQTILSDASEYLN
jgi:hypothetical protein